MDEKSDKLEIKLPRGSKDKIIAYAGKNYSRYVRALIEHDMRRNGIEIDLEMKHGGARIEGEE